MDNGNKMKPEKKPLDNGNKTSPEMDPQTTSLIEKSKALFLRDIISEFKNKQQHYDIGEEFAKTKKNRSVLIYVIILGMVALFSIGVYVLTNYIQTNSKNIIVDIDDFKDVRLQELLDTVKRYETGLHQTRRELADLVNKRNLEIHGINEDAARRESIVTSGTTDEAERRRQISQIRSGANAQIASINEKYQPQIEEKEQKIAEFEMNIAEYDTKQIEQARQQEENLNNQQKLFDFELAKLTEYYETQIASLNNQYETDTTALKNHNISIRNILYRKYNPTFSEGEVQSLLDSPIDEETGGRQIPGEFHPTHDVEDGYLKAQYLKMFEASSAIETLVGRLKVIPHENSIPLAIQQVEYQHKLALDAYEEIWKVLAEKVIAANARIDQFSYAMESLTSSQKENGYIIDPRDSENIIVHIDWFQEIKGETQGFVFRRDDFLIGKIKILLEDSEVKVSLLELEDEKIGLQPFDKILIDVHAEQFYE